MNYHFHPAAEQELYDAIAHYESRRPGLGAEFLLEVTDSINSMCRQPQQFPLLDEQIRVAQTKRFPYGLIFQDGEEISVIAVMHLHRSPGYWTHRVR